MNKRVLGIWIFAILLIERCLRHMWYMRNFEGQMILFSEHDYNFALLRYQFSYCHRMVGIVLCLGIIFKKEIFRKLMLCYLWFNVLTIYWKHPYDAIYKVATSAYMRWPFPGKIFMQYDLTQEQLTWCWIIFFSTVEVVFCSWMIFYLTRPKVKALFK